MSWQILRTEDILSEFTQSEAGALRTLQSGSGTGSGFPFLNIDSITIRIMDEVRGYINAGGFELDSDPRTIPTSLFEDAIAIGRWRVLIAVPAFQNLQTEERRKAFEAALAKLLLIAEGKFNVDEIGETSVPRTGCWNSENKLIMRTHPIPRPGSQFGPQTDAYANPDAPADQEPDA